MTPEQAKAKSEYEAAAKKLQSSKMGDKGVEKLFADAYQRLVALGMAMQIRKRYR